MKQFYNALFVLAILPFTVLAQTNTIKRFELVTPRILNATATLLTQIDRNYMYFHQDSDNMYLFATRISPSATILSTNTFTLQSAIQGLPLYTTKPISVTSTNNNHSYLICNSFAYDVSGTI